MVRPVPLSFHIVLQAGSLAVLTGGLLLGLPLVLVRGVPKQE